MKAPDVRYGDDPKSEIYRYAHHIAQKRRASVYLCGCRDGSWAVLSADELSPATLSRCEVGCITPAGWSSVI